MCLCVCMCVSVCVSECEAAQARVKTISDFDWNEKQHPSYAVVGVGTAQRCYGVTHGGHVAVEPDHHAHDARHVLRDEMCCRVAIV